MNRTGNERAGSALMSIPTAAGKTIAEASMVAVNSSGYAEPAAKAEGLLVAGCAMSLTDNSSGSNGAVNVPVKRGVFVWNNDGTISADDVLKPCYISDQNTVTLAPDGSSPAGIIIEADSGGVTVDMTYAPVLAAMQAAEREGGTE